MAGADSVHTVAALGRPFHLGSLYDVRSDQIISGVTLWNKSDLEKETYEQRKWSSDFKVITSDSISDKKTALDISGNLSLSIMSGLVTAAGSGEYIKETKTSTHQARVTLQYKCITKAMELTMYHLGAGNITYPHILEQGIATHVVTGIEYGAHAFFVFDRIYNLKENEKVVSGKLQAMIKKIPNLVPEGEFKYDSEEETNNKSENITCTFCGDFKLNRNPATYKEAFSTYTKLPKLLGEDGKNAVPVKVQLFPLKLLGSNAGRLVQDISSHLVSNTEKTLETLTVCHAKCNDLLEYPAARHSSRIKQEVSDFMFLVQTFKHSLQKDLFLMLPAIRGGGKEEVCLDELLKKKELSPFSNSALLSWMNRQEEQIKILNGYIRSLKKKNIASGPSDLQSMIMDLDTKQVFCLVINVPKLSSQIDKMNEYLQMSDAKKGVQLTEKANMTVVKPETNINMNIRAFKEFADCNEDNTMTKFVITEESCDSEQFSATIRYYKNGDCITEAYELPIAPENVKTEEKDVHYDHITVHWSKPVYGSSNIKWYRIKYKEKKLKRKKNKTEWSETCQATLPHLKPNTKYVVYVRAWCEFGISPRSTITVSTRPASPPGQIQVHQTSTNMVHLYWSPPKVVASGCSIVNYTFRKRKTKGEEDWLALESSDSETCHKKIKLNTKSPLEFTVAAVCTSGGQSEHSQVNDGSKSAGEYSL